MTTENQTIDKYRTYFPRVEVATQFAKERNVVGLKKTLTRLVESTDWGEEGLNFVNNSFQKNPRFPQELLESFLRSYQNIEKGLKVGDLADYYNEEIAMEFDEETLERAESFYNEVRDMAYVELIQKVADAKNVIESKTASEEDKERAGKVHDKYARLVGPIERARERDAYNLRTSIEPEVYEEINRELFKKED